LTRSLHREAETDLALAFRYYKAEAGVGIAGRLLTEFERVTRLLEAQPCLGTPTSDSRRSYPLAVFPYSVIHRETETGIRILVVRHHSRDPAFGEGRS
jgi:plasmid stabilization system protein ParE